MTREDILKEILSLKGNNLLLELPTGVGKVVKIEGNISCFF